MTDMFIVPLTSSITPMTSITDKTSAVNKEDEEGGSFLDIFKTLVDNAVQTDKQVQQDSIDLMLGDVDDLAQIQTNLAKAATALELLVTVKNQAVDAYNEIMRMTI